VIYLFRSLRSRSIVFKNVTNSEVEPGLILFVGNGVPDGHGILVDGMLQEFAKMLKIASLDIE